MISGESRESIHSETARMTREGFNSLATGTLLFRLYDPTRTYNTSSNTMEGVEKAMKWHFVRSGYMQTSLHYDSADNVFERGFQDSS